MTNADSVCIVVSGVCFLSFKTFPDLWEDHLEPAAAGTLVDVRAMMKRLTGSGSLGPSSPCSSDSCLHGEEGGEGPRSLCLERPSPPSSPGELLLVLQDPAPAASPPGSLPCFLRLLPLCSPIFRASLYLSQDPHAVCCCSSLSLLPPADCELLEGRDQCHVPVCASCCVRWAPSGCGECLVN